jgi:hypothetical protein
MKKSPRQPTMDEWLLDSLHGLHDGADEEALKCLPSHFVSSLTYSYVCALQPKQRAFWLDRQIKTVFSRSIWPRLLIARCRVVLATALPLISNGHWIIMDWILNSLRLVMRYIGIILHGLRLLTNLALLVKPLFIDAPLEGMKHAFSYSWFELFIDSHSLLSAFLPANFLITSCALSVLELGIFMLRGWFEYRRIAVFKELFSKELGRGGLTKEHFIEIKKSEAHAIAALNHQCKKLALNLAVMAVSIFIFVLKHFILTSLSIALVTNPVVPLIFAVLALGLTLANHFISQHLDKGKPKIKMTQLSGKMTFFKEHQFPMEADAKKQSLESSEPLINVFVSAGRAYTYC